MTHYYERVRFEGHTVILRDPVLTVLLGELVLTGIEVNKEGEEIAGRGADERRHIISLSVITKRTELVWNNHYGMLEEAPTNH